ncbi:hypothetical protein [Thermomonospora cellulosilytica]|uniref:Uncharacterized protein n=1 Tax=Thermomonospora cellulosilytica TaxID=1411118 RepID=A0A7W3R798_9ACTN|nr:hypothetical protein [Thermomonospora cellulosilytica]MBA9002264.1 hypothetical protein [Thermomonospora cellulosilytica]
MLECLAALARPGAHVYAVGHDPYTGHHALHRAYHDRNRAEGRLPGQVTMRLRYQGRVSPWFDRLLLSQDELADLLEGSPWKLAACGTPDGRGFYLATLQLVA